MCLGIIERFGDQIGNQIDTYVEGIFNAIHDLALHKKSWKAIRHVRLDIEERLDHLDNAVAAAAVLQIHIVRVAAVLHIYKKTIILQNLDYGRLG